MTDRYTLDERLDELGRELQGSPTLVAEVMARLPVVEAPRRASRRWRTWALTAVAGLALVSAAWVLRPQSLYARALDALAKARTIHMSGWTMQVDRRWPLEQPGAQEESRRHEVDAWYWRDEDGTPRCYEKRGPVVVTRQGSTLHEYQQDVDLLYVSQVRPKDYLESLSTVAEYLRALEGDALVKEDLGMRNEAGQMLHGIRIVKPGLAQDYWFDAQSDRLMRVSISRPQGNGEADVTYQMRFAYDEPLPESVVQYAPPETTNVRHGSRRDEAQLAWRSHVEQIGEQLAAHPPARPITVLPREGQQTFALQYEMTTPDGRYTVVPLDQDQNDPLTVRNFINLRVATEDGKRAPQTWRVDDDLLDLEFPRADLIYEQGTTWQEWVQFALAQLGLEFVDSEEMRTHWIAHHDGRELKPWRQVDPPVPYIVEGGIEKKGLVRPGVGYRLVPRTMHGLFMDFNRLQNQHYTADGPIVIDQTGLPRAPQWDREAHPTFAEYQDAVLDDYYVATDSPWFVGEESRPMARKWFEKEFGVTFDEEPRRLEIHVVRKKP